MDMDDGQLEAVAGGGFCFFFGGTNGREVTCSESGRACAYVGVTTCDCQQSSSGHSPNRRNGGPAHNAASSLSLAVQVAKETKVGSE